MAPDLLENEPAPSRRGAIALGSVVAGVVAAVALSSSHGAPSGADVVDLVVLAEVGADQTLLAATASMRLQLLLQVRNEGSGGVMVLRGGVAGYGLLRPVEVEPGATATLPLERTVPCSAEPAPAPAEALELAVRAAGDIRQVRVALPFAVDVDRPARACGFVPLDQALALQVVEARVSDDELLLDVEVVTSSNQPLRVVDALPLEPGLVATTEERELPVPGPGTSAGTTVVARITVTDCAAVQPVLRTPGARSLTLVVRDRDGAQVQPRVEYDPALLEELVATSC